MNLRAIIVDDEPLARENLRLLLESYCPQVHILAACKNATEALTEINAHHPDVIFLDIQMPGKSGIELAEEIQHQKSSIVFVTAHDEYAIRAFRLSAIDYLLKPVDPKQLIQAVHKCQNELQIKISKEQLKLYLSNYAQTDEQIALPTMSGLDICRLADVVCFAADESYCEVWMADKSKKVISRKLGELEEILPTHNFVRLHKSYIVNIKHITKYIKGEGGQVVLSNGETVDVSRRKKEELLQHLHRI
ncbi:MAG: response regulator [Chitinophagales bacterium]|nr:response regulator [Chitinophagales bacterium]